MKPALFLVIAALMCLCSCRSNPAHDNDILSELNACRIAVEIDGGVGIFSGTGKHVSHFPDRSRLKSLTEKRPLRPSYHTPCTDQRGQQFASVRRQSRSHIIEGWRDYQYSVVVIRLSDLQERELWRGAGDEPVSSPVWSPDGHQLAFLTYRDVVIINATTGEQISRHENVIPGQVIVPSDTLHYLRWRADGRWIFVYHDLRVYAVDLTTQRRGMLDMGGIQFIGGVLNGRPVYGEGVAPAPAGELPDIPAIQALFASPKHPVHAPQYSESGRYAFSVVRAAGRFHEQYWLHCLDRSTGQTRPLRVLDRNWTIYEQLRDGLRR